MTKAIEARPAARDGGVSAAALAQDMAVPAALNLSLGLALAAANLFALFALPLLLPANPWWGLALVPVALSAPTHWSLIHEAIHGVLLPRQVWNERAGRVLAALFGSPFQLLRLGHLMHHRFNRTVLNRSEVIEPPKPVGAVDRAAYYFRLFGGLYLGELAAAPLATMPDRFYRPIIHLVFGDEAPDGRTMWRAARKQLLEEPGRTRMRLDGLVVTAGLALGLWLYGPWWWMLAAMLAARGLLISFLDNVYHYEAPLEDVMGGYNLRLPRALMRAYLNFNLHATHHRRPSAPWTALPGLAERLGHRCHDALWPAALRQLRGPLRAEDVPPAASGPGA